MKKFLPSLFLLSLFLIFPDSVSATVANLSEKPLDEAINSLSLKFVFGSTVLIVLTFLFIFLTKNRESLKKYFFLSIVIPVIITTLFLAGSTIYLNQVSSTKGPVHWHADFEIWNCGKKVNLVDPTGFSNKIGTATFHEHNDDRLHVEGVVLKEEDVNFGSFIKVIGGKLEEGSLTLPTTEGEVTLQDGTECSDGTLADLQVFIYSVEGKNIGREKVNLSELKTHILSPHGSVPPGDCIIIELSESKTKTDKLCTFYKTAISQGKFSY